MEFTTRQPYVNSSDKVVSVTIGAKEVDGEYSAEVEKSCSIAEAEQKILADWTEAEIDALCTSTATEQNWQAKLNADIAAQKDGKPVAAFFHFWDGGTTQRKSS